MTNDKSPTSPCSLGSKSAEKTLSSALVLPLTIGLPSSPAQQSCPSPSPTLPASLRTVTSRQGFKNKDCGFKICICIEAKLVSQFHWVELSCSPDNCIILTYLALECLIGIIKIESKKTFYEDFMLFHYLSGFVECYGNISCG